MSRRVVSLSVIGLMLLVSEPGADATVRDATNPVLAFGVLRAVSEQSSLAGRTVSIFEFRSERDRHLLLDSLASVLRSRGQPAVRAARSPWTMLSWRTDADTVTLQLRDARDGCIGWLSVWSPTNAPSPSKHVAALIPWPEIPVTEFASRDGELVSVVAVASVPYEVGRTAADVSNHLQSQGWVRRSGAPLAPGARRWHAQFESGPRAALVTVTAAGARSGLAIQLRETSR